MGVKSVREAYGPQWGYVDAPLVRTYRPQGSTTDSLQRIYNAFSLRNNHTSNGIVMVKGVPFRPPSNYERHAARWSYEASSWIENPTYAYSGVRGSVALGSVQTCMVPAGNGTEINVGMNAASGTNSNAQNRANVECMNKIGDQKIQLGTFLAESVRSANTLAVAVSDFARILIAVKRRNWQYFKSEWGDIRDLPSGLLRWRYGLQPLASDIYAAADIVRNGLGTRAQIFSASRSITSTATPTGVVHGYTWDGNVTMQNSCTIHARLSDSFCANASKLGLVNPLEAAWELVPWSFAVDWVMPIGNFLSGLSASAGLTFVGGYTGQRVSYEFRGRSPTRSPCDGKSFSYRRTKLTGFPSLRPYVKSPFSLPHVENALALLAVLHRNR